MAKTKKDSTVKKQKYGWISILSICGISFLYAMGIFQVAFFLKHDIYTNLDTVNTIAQVSITILIIVIISIIIEKWLKLITTQKLIIRLLLTYLGAYFIQLAYVISKILLRITE